METSKTLTGEQSSDLTLFAVDTLVSHLAPQASGKAQTMQDTYGLGSETRLAHYNRLTQSWRMSEDTSLWGEYKLLENLPQSGMTQNGVLYQQPAWERHIDVIESSLWPTPTTQEVEHPNAELTKTGRRKSKDNTTSHSLGLADAVRMWPTPTVDDSTNVTRKSGAFQSLVRSVQETSQASGKLNPVWVEWLMGFPIGWTDLED